jgi:glutamyl-tRNA(Gln) amidotransferase subunit D
VSEKELPGYRGVALEALKMAGVKAEDQIRIVKNGQTFEGILIPRSEYGDDAHVVIKIKSGYNLGIKVTPATGIERIGAGAKLAFYPPTLPEQKPDLPKVAIISTGGTIASRVDYRTGGVRPALSAQDLYSVVPELSEIALVNAQILYSLFSENITPKHWLEIAETAAHHIEKGVAGVVVAHGTDTMGYTAAALSFALQNLPVPVILVGSQRSADRPSSDAATNLTGAVTAAARAPFAEVVLAMHETISDEAILFHRGTKVRKCHTSRRDTFKSVNASPLARIINGQVEIISKDYRERDSTRKLVLKPHFSERVALVKFHPGLDPRVIQWYVDEGYRGIILEGTGLGHISHHCYSAVRRAIKNNVVVAMTSQCIWGRVQMSVYDTGRDLLEMGVTPLEDMLPETALVKLMWALGQTKDAEDARELLITSIANEISLRTIEV